LGTQFGTQECAERAVEAVDAVRILLGKFSFIDLKRVNQGWRTEKERLAMKTTRDNLTIMRIGSWLRQTCLVVEHQLETFYNFHITPWLRLTGDLQIIRPTRPIANTAIIPGGRLMIIF